MGEILRKACDEQYKNVIKEVLNMLEQVEEECLNDSKNFEEYKALAIEKIENMVKQSEPKRKGLGWDFNKEKELEEFVSDEVILLKPMSDEYFEPFMKVKKENAYYIANIYDVQEGEKTVWKYVEADNAFYCAIIRRLDGAFVGYCAIKDTSENLWELAMELGVAYHKQGYGFRSMNLFLSKISEITGKTQFQALVEVENIACRALMKKVQAKLVTIENFVFDSEEDARVFEEAHLNEITDEMIELAEMLDVEPRKMLSHVLDYRIVL